MVTPFTGFKAEDGSKFECEADAYRHEIKAAIISKHPAIKSSIGIIMDDIEWFANILLPVSSILNKPPLTGNKPPLRPETTPTMAIRDPALDDEYTGRLQAEYDSGLYDIESPKPNLGLD